MKLTSKIASIFFPHKCTFCREAIDYDNYTFICPGCADSLPFIQGSRCLKCGRPQDATALPVCFNCRRHKHAFSGSYIPLLYRDNVRRSLINMKFYDKDNYSRSYAYLITSRIIEEGFPDFDFITYIPLSRRKYRERGFNQAKLIAKYCSEILHLPVIDTLYRIDDSYQQSTLSAKERRKNVKKSFKPKDIRLHGTALLIDDVYTTGATAAFTTSLLLKMGCDKVYIACLALKEKNS